MNEALVVVFSWSGNTRRVGSDIAQRLKCPMVEITEVRKREGGLAYLRSIYEVLTGRLPELEKFSRNLREFPLLVVGTPVWAGHVSSPMRSFLAAHREDGGMLCAFCTMGGRDPGSTFSEIAMVSGKVLGATLALSEREQGSPEYSVRIDEFTATIRSLPHSA